MEAIQDHSQSLKIGNRFEIADLKRDLLGQGGMGDVYRGTDIQTGQAVAIKVLRSETTADNPDGVSRFLREGKALRQLNHPNIVKMVAAFHEADAVEEKGRHYLVMEYVGGGSLRDLMQQNDRLSIARVVEIALDVADALTRAHRLGIVHRDLKPGNVLLTEEGTPRLTDFGLAHLAGAPRLTQTGIIVGTVDYLCPEACSGKTPSALADIWSFGVMLYEMLTGEPPFAGESLAAAVTAILTHPVPDLSRVRPDVPDALADLIYRMLERDCQRRIPSMRLVGAELEAILEAIKPSAIYRQPSPTSGRFATSSPRSAMPKHNLPPQPTPFVGREAELIELSQLLADPDVRLVTILGPGGMGKTRLALQVAETQLDRFSDGVYFVSLAPLQSTEAIVPTIAEALSLSFYPAAGGGAMVTPRQQLLDHLRGKRMLLLLDNVEHLLPPAPGGEKGVAVLVTDMLKTAPDVIILATSSTRLNVQGEHRFQVSGLDYPGTPSPASSAPARETPEGALEYSALQLFMQSARRAQPGFELAGDDVEHVTRICRLVRGMPLGILLAAAWVEMLSPEEIAREIAHGIAPVLAPDIGHENGLALGPRASGPGLDLLETEMRDVPERQRSIRAVFDYSWNLLTEREREALQRLSVFRGGFTRQAAQQVTGASLRALIALVNKSLLHRTPTGRYEIHELLRQYAALELCRSSIAALAALKEHSAIAPAEHSPTVPGRRCISVHGRYCVAVNERHCAAIRDRHCAHYAAALQEWGTDLKGARQRAALAEIELEIENIRTAWSWAAERGYAEQLDRAMEGLGLFYDWHGLSQEGETAFRAAAEGLASTAEQSITAPWPSDKGLPSASRSPEQVWAEALAWQSVFSQSLGHTEQARQLLKRSSALLERPELADRDTRPQQAFILWAMGGTEADRQKARSLYERSLALYRALGDPWWTARTLSDLGVLAHVSGDYGQAIRRLEESVNIYRALGNRKGLADSASELGLVHAYRGQIEQAERLGRESLVMYQKLGDQLGCRSECIILGATLVHLGRYAGAHSLLQEGEAISADLALRRRSVSWMSNLGFAKVHLGRYEGARAHAQKTLALTRESGSPSALCTLGYVALAEGAYAEAQRLLQQYVAVNRERGQQGFLAESLAVLVCAEHGLGDHVQAERHLCEALRIVADTGAFIPLLTALPAAALLLADRGEIERAVELYALASRYPQVANSRWFEDVAGRHIEARTGSVASHSLDEPEAVALPLPPDAIAAAQERGRARDLDATVGQLLAELETGYFSHPTS